MTTDKTANALAAVLAYHRGWTAKQFTRIRQIHDTAAVRAAGFAPGG